MSSDSAAKDALYKELNFKIVYWNKTLLQLFPTKSRQTIYATFSKSLTKFVYSLCSHAKESSAVNEKWKVFKVFRALQLLPLANLYSICIECTSLFPFLIRTNFHMQMQKPCSRASLIIFNVVRGEKGNEGKECISLFANEMKLLAMLPALTVCLSVSLSVCPSSPPCLWCSAASNQPVEALWCFAALETR